MQRRQKQIQPTDLKLKPSGPSCENSVGGRADKDASIRIEALSMLGNSASSADLWVLYQAETSVEVKERILQRLKDLGATERLLEVAKTEKEPNLRQYAMRALSSVTTEDALVGLYAAETDQAVKRTIVDACIRTRMEKRSSIWRAKRTIRKCSERS
jgi:HEAT repeat protein